jgi:predicted glycoside hydrolase/deacetylase ChbG (UPF0249 family)
MRVRFDTDFAGPLLCVGCENHPWINHKTMPAGIASNPVKLIVNADDYGYFSCVSRGILKAAADGCVTATGIMANSNRFHDAMEQLKYAAGLDIGVHLNLTFGIPLTTGMKQQLEKWDGNFPSKFELAKAVVSGSIRIDLIEQELGAQIERCRDAGLQVLFLNSHEHIHMIPAIFKKTLELSDYYQIPFVRYTSSEWLGKVSTEYLLRNIAFTAVNMFNKRSRHKHRATLIGTSESGKLNLGYLKKRLPRLKPGMVYELMCHPGYFDPGEINNPDLLAYHDWAQEFELMTGPEIVHLLEQRDIMLVGYRDVLSSEA